MYEIAFLYSLTLPKITVVRFFVKFIVRSRFQAIFFDRVGLYSTVTPSAAEPTYLNSQRPLVRLTFRLGLRPNVETDVLQQLTPTCTFKLGLGLVTSSAQGSYESSLLLFLFSSPFCFFLSYFFFFVPLFLSSL